MSTAALAFSFGLMVLALVAGIAIGWLWRRQRETPVRITPIAVPGDAGRPRGTSVPPSASTAMPPEHPTPRGAAPELSNPSTDRPVAPTQPPTSNAAALLARAQSWGYQLQDLELGRSAASPFDVLVIDYSRDGSHSGALKPSDIARLQRKPDGSRRLVIAYLSIGEAESYRSYWKKEWKRERPDWLLSENPDWEENYAVCYWDPGWQANLCGSADAYLDRILAQGFDGIYLDKCDVGEDLKQREKKAARSRPDLDGDMIALVERLAAYARAKRPGFLVVMQNAEPLLERPQLRAVIDAVAKEELLFGLDGNEKANGRDEILWSQERLELMRRDGKPVFVVEYLNDRAKIAKAAATLRGLGYVPYISDKSRELDKLVYTVEVA